MAHRHHEVGANERVDLTELHRLGLVDVTSRLQDREQCLSVTFYLRPLVGIDRVLYRQWVQPELLSHGGELLLGGLVETYPCQPVTFATGLVSLLEGGRFRFPATVYVDGVVHYHVAYDTPISRHRSGSKGTLARRLPPQVMQLPIRAQPSSRRDSRRTTSYPLPDRAPQGDEGWRGAGYYKSMRR